MAEILELERFLGTYKAYHAKKATLVARWQRLCMAIEKKQKKKSCLCVFKIFPSFLATFFPQRHAHPFSGLTLPSSSSVSRERVSSPLLSVYLYASLVC
jgi:hypothetical protein